MIVIVWYTTHLSRKAISNALLTSSDETTVEAVADTEVAELLRVNSSDALAAMDHLHTPLSSGRAAAAGHPHVSIFAAAATSPRGEVLELAALGGGGKLGGGGGTPQHAAPAVAKKNTPASAAEAQLLLDGGQRDAGSSSAVHHRASYTSGSATPSGGASPGPLGLLSNMRSRLTSAL